MTTPTPDLTEPFGYLNDMLKEAKRRRKEVSDRIDSMQTQLDAAKAERDIITVDVANWQAAVDLMAASMPAPPIAP
jgi:hypothetical protein